MATETDKFCFSWAGKGNLRKVIQAPVRGVLKPDIEKSVDYNETKNVVIVGDNLDALKILRKAYLGKIKMIYIDPPYNTGKNFVYKDNLKKSMTGQVRKTDDIWKELNTNIEAIGRHHSAWLNFIYPRLFLAKGLLRDDGVIFVSIDDHEVHYLKIIMDEIFGEKNFICTFIRRSGTGPRHNAKHIAKEHDYIVCYSKNINKAKINKKINKTGGFNYEDEYVNERGRYKLDDIRRRKVDSSESMWFPITAPDGSNIYPGESPTDKQWRWIWSKEKVKWGIENGFIVFKKDKKGNWKVYKKEYEKVNNEGKPEIKTLPYTTFIMNEYNGKNIADTDKLLGIRAFSYPKPVSLIEHLLKIGSDKDSIILDFFAGSGTTGHAVWDLNREDGGNRKFILVQLDEKVTDENIRKRFSTIADICIERLRRVSERYKKENKSKLINNQQDLGFRVFKISK